MACAILVCVVGLSGAACSDDDWKSPRCSAYQNFQEQCAPSCPQFTDCELLDTLESLPASALDLTAFDACITCLDSEATAGTCRDCELEPGGETCQELLTDWLELDCL